MIEVNGLVKRFDGFAALDGAALSVPAGSVYGLVGPNGAGKSTLIRHLTGIFRHDAGTVRKVKTKVNSRRLLKALVAADEDNRHGAHRRRGCVGERRPEGADRRHP